MTTFLSTIQTSAMAMTTMILSMSTILGFLSFSCFCVNEINALQRFAEQPKYTEVNPGQDAFLTCKIIDKRGTCSWQKDNKPVGIYPKKYEWAGMSMTVHQTLQPPHIGGDCSLWIRSATLDFDDGLWECQVTASDFTTQDALTSQPVRLVVRVAPQRPRLEHEGVHVPPGHNVTVDSGAVATVKCISHYGNPPAVLKWYSGDQEILPLHPQTNATEPDNPRTWSAASVVQVQATRERHGEMLRCLAYHESYAAKSVAVEARLDVKYAPTIRLLGAPQIDLEEGKDALILRCKADANPSASIVWRRAGRSEIASLQETLQLSPVGRRDAGLYTCQAQNSVGSSEQLSLQLDVKYPPRILSAGPDRLTTAPLYSPAAFECVAEGNPPPTYKWLQRSSQGSSHVERGSESRLVIDNVTYDYQGEYECRATNFINGQERTVTSEPVSLQVVGAPQVLRLNPLMHTVSVKKGESASLSLVVCADPRPRHVAWEWGSLRLEAGAGIGRYRVDDVVQDSREDCYLATLHINDADIQDARPYYLVVENERGTDRHAIHLSVEEPLEMSYLLGIAGGCIAALLILICLCIYAIRAKKCCFKGRSGYKSSDKDSEKADLKSRSDSTSGPQGDSIYTTPAGFHHHHHPSQGSPEAMKSATLQNALLWQNEQPSTLYHHTKSRSTGGTLLGPSTTLQRHQRDLFTGDLGIPEITTRVGSVVHAFETMAMLRRHAEKPYDDEDIDRKSTAGKTKTTRSTKSGGSQSRYSKMKKKSNESRHKISLTTNLPTSHNKNLINTHASDNHNIEYRPVYGADSSLGIPRVQSHAVADNSFLISGDNTVVIGNSRSLDKTHSSSWIRLPGFDDDYRKNQFCNKQKRSKKSQILDNHKQSKTTYKSNDINDDIINNAFKDIFDNEEDTNDEMNNNNNNKSSSKIRAKSDVNDNDDDEDINHKRREFRENQLQPIDDSNRGINFFCTRRSATFDNLFDMKKSKNSQSIHNKYPSSLSYTMLHDNKDSRKLNQSDFDNYKRDLKYYQRHQEEFNTRAGPYDRNHQTQHNQLLQQTHKSHLAPSQNPKQKHKHDTNLSLSDDSESFIRGSTVSQSFIKNVKNSSGSNYSHPVQRQEGNNVMSSGNLQDNNRKHVDGVTVKKRQAKPSTKATAPKPPVAKNSTNHLQQDQKHCNQFGNPVHHHPQKRSKSSSEIVDELQKSHLNESHPCRVTSTPTIRVRPVIDDGALRPTKRSNAFQPNTIDRAEI